MSQHQEAQMIDWVKITEDDLPPEETLVIVSGFNMGNPKAGRWVSFARRIGCQYFSDETGEELFTPTHYHRAFYPRD